MSRAGRVEERPGRRRPRGGRRRGPRGSRRAGRCRTGRASGPGRRDATPGTRRAARSPGRRLHGASTLAGPHQPQAEDRQDRLRGAEDRLGLGHAHRPAGGEGHQRHRDHVADHRRADRAGARAAGEQQRHQGVGRGQGGERVGEPDERHLPGHGGAAHRVVEGGEEQEVQHHGELQGDVLHRRQRGLPQQRDHDHEEQRQHGELDREALDALGARLLERRLAHEPQGAVPERVGAAGSRSATTPPGWPGRRPSRGTAGTGCTRGSSSRGRWRTSRHTRASTPLARDAAALVASRPRPASALTSVMVMAAATLVSTAWRDANGTRVSRPAAAPVRVRTMVRSVGADRGA